MKFDLEHIFSFHDSPEVDFRKSIRNAAKRFAAAIINYTPPGADQSAAVRKVREAVMTANAAIALGGRLHTAPLDEESRRVTAEYREVIDRKRRGEQNVMWDPDHRLRYRQVVEIHPRARVAVRQIGPEEDENIDSQPISFLNTYEKLVAYLREGHWDRHGRKHAEYKWMVYDDANPQWAAGRIMFQAEEEE